VAFRCAAPVFLVTSHLTKDGEACFILNLNRCLEHCIHDQFTDGLGLVYRACSPYSMQAEFKKENAIGHLIADVGLLH